MSVRKWKKHKLERRPGDDAWKTENNRAKVERQMPLITEETMEHMNETTTLIDSSNVAVLDVVGLSVVIQDGQLESASFGDEVSSEDQAAFVSRHKKGLKKDRIIRDLRKLTRREKWLRIMTDRGTL